MCVFSRVVGMKRGERTSGRKMGSKKFGPLFIKTHIFSVIQKKPIAICVLKNFQEVIKHMKDEGKQLRQQIADHRNESAPSTA